MSSYKNAPMNLEQAISIINELEQKVEDLQNSLKVVMGENGKLEEQVELLQKSLTSSLQILARQGTEVKLSQLEDVLQQENDELTIKFMLAKEALKKINER